MCNRILDFIWNLEKTEEIKEKENKNKFKKQKKIYLDKSGNPYFIKI